MNAFPFPAAETWARLDPVACHRGPWAEFRHRQMGDFLHELVKFSPFDLGLAQAGLSSEGRALHTIRFGARGGKRVFIWARQHGNEPDCTAGLCMALAELVLQADAPLSRFLRERLDIGILPMVNPDGVARFTRENAQGIDINRDAVATATPEGRTLREIFEQFRPQYCFNLHDMSPRKATAEGRLTALSFQAGPFDATDSDNEVRLRAKALCARMFETASGHAPGHFARYRADYMHRAFGDSMMRWGVSSVLIEAGGWSGEDGDTFVRRLFALALLRGLHAIAAAEDDPATAAAAYEAIPFDTDGRFADRLLRGTMVHAGFGRPPFRADIHIDCLDAAPRANAPVRNTGTIANLGDLEDQKAKESIDGAGQIAMPGFVVFAPTMRGSGNGIGESDAKALLRAGITTVAVGYGPFDTAAERDRWLEHATHAEPPPVNIAAFEIVAGFDEIRRRHGMTEFAGFLVRDLVMDASELLEFSQLFHPARHLALHEEDSARLIGIDLFFVPSPSPGGTHLRLHLTQLEETGGRRRTDREEMQRFCSDFLRHPGQISMTCDPNEATFVWLPILLDIDSLGRSVPPPKEFLGQVLGRWGGRLPSTAASFITMLTRRPARVLHLEHRLGTISLQRQADIAVFDAAPFDTFDPEPLAALAPRQVLFNGVPVLNADGTVRLLPRGIRVLSASWDG